MDPKTFQLLGLLFGAVGTGFIFLSRKSGRKLVLWLGIVLVLQSAGLYFWPVVAGG